MNTNKIDISKLIDTYSKHEWIDLSEYPEYPINDDTSPAELNLQCKNIIKEWLETNRGLSSQEDFPYSVELERNRLVSQLVNGFCLKVDNGDGIISKIVFIPNEQIDIDSFKVAQEWVDLTNWLGDYYVPIQVDVDAQQLHLWGMITHQELKQTGELDDEMFRYYNVDADRMVDNLEVLWTSCELAPDPRSTDIPKLVTQGVEGLIDRVKSEAGTNFDRLILAFEQWGAILDEPEYLNQYLQSVFVTAPFSKSKPTALGDIFKETTVTINRTWKKLEEYLSPYQPALVFRDSSPALRSRLAPKQVRGVSFNTPEDIDRQIKILYKRQSLEFPIVELPNHIQDPSELLTHLVQNTSDDNLRWAALEYLWTISPNHDLAKNRRFRELEIFGQDRLLVLLIAKIRKNEEVSNILARVYSADRRSKLPPNLKLLLLDENDNLATEYPVISQTEFLDDYIDVHFCVLPDCQFSISIQLNDIIYTEEFIN